MQIELVLRPEAAPEEELQELMKPNFATQWNAALYDDDCLLVVPGSHRRVRTPEEKRVCLAGDGRGVMPGYPTSVTVLTR